MAEQDVENANPGDLSLWICGCGKDNYGNFCVACGHPRTGVKPVNEIQASTDNDSSGKCLQGTADFIVNKADATTRSLTSTAEGPRSQWKPILLGAGFIALTVVAFFATKNFNFIAQTPKNVTAEQTQVSSGNSSSASIYKGQQKNIEEIKETPVEQASQQKSAATQMTPIQVLQAFHQNITNKKYREAYNYLSKDFQDYVSYDGWAPGFRTTISSTVSNVTTVSQTDSQAVLTYTLKAVDNPGGTRYFRGTATFIKTADGWKIDEITNKAQ